MRKTSVIGTLWVYKGTDRVEPYMVIDRDRVNRGTVTVQSMNGAERTMTDEYFKKLFRRPSLELMKKWIGMRTWPRSFIDVKKVS